MIYGFLNRWMLRLDEIDRALPADGPIFDLGCGTVSAPT